MSLRDLQRKFDVARADTGALERDVTAAVGAYRRHPSPSQHRQLARAVGRLLCAQGDRRYCRLIGVSLP